MTTEEMAGEILGPELLAHVQRTDPRVVRRLLEANLALMEEWIAAGGKNSLLPELPEFIAQISLIRSTLASTDIGREVSE